MELVAEIFLGMINLLMYFLWFRWMFMMDGAMEEFELSASTATGKNFIRGDVAGIILFIAVCITLFLFLGAPLGLSILILMAIMVAQRLLSFVLDGFSKTGLLAVIAEAAIFFLVLYLR